MLLCAACGRKPARYGFRDDAWIERPSTLCFECFLDELERRQAITDLQEREAHVEQLHLPLPARKPRR